MADEGPTGGSDVIKAAAATPASRIEHTGRRLRAFPLVPCPGGSQSTLHPPQGFGVNRFMHNLLLTNHLQSSLLQVIAKYGGAAR